MCRYRLRGRLLVLLLSSDRVGVSQAAHCAPDDKAVRCLLLKLKKQRTETRRKEKGDLQGLFGRGELYDQKSLAEQVRRAPSFVDHVMQGDFLLALSITNSLVIVSSHEPWN